MNVATLEKKGSPFYKAFLKLREEIIEFSIRYDVSIRVCPEVVSIDDYSIKVFLRGDKDLVNMVTIRMVAWQLRELEPYAEGFIYVYPEDNRSG